MPEEMIPIVIIIWFRRCISIVDVYIENIVILLFTWDAGHTKLSFALTLYIYMYTIKVNWYTSWNCNNRTVTFKSDL